MSQKMFVLSPCGTSILTNYGDKELTALARAYANTKKLSDIPPEDARQLTLLIGLAAEALRSSSIGDAARASAELNGIIRLYHGKIAKGNDHHVILATDTWLGEQSATMVADWLRANGLTAEVLRQKDLQTSDIGEFQSALSDLVRWCEETLPGYRDSLYRIVFNLTGGFKSVQGFLTILASFYADESVYIFETSDQLLRIPKLPIRMDATESIRENIPLFRRLGLGLEVKDAATIPETLLFKLEGEYSLSQWGELVWLQTKNTFYQEKLLSPPSAKIRYAPTFEPSVKGLPKDRMALVNSRIDDLARFLETGANIKSLEVKGIKNPKNPYSKEFDAWSDKDARRFYGDFEGDIFVIGVLGEHL